MPVKKNPDPGHLTRSYRVKEEVWYAARERSAADGRTLNKVVGQLIEGYARGYYKLPRERKVTEFPAAASIPQPPTAEN